MSFLFFLFLSSTLISQSFMDAISVIVLIVSLFSFFKKQIRRDMPFLKTTSLSLQSSQKNLWLVFFLSWIGVIALGLLGKETFFQAFFEWKWVLNLYSLYWFLQQIDFLKQSTLIFPLTSRFADLKKENKNNFSRNGYSLLIYRFYPLFIVLLICFSYGSLSLFLNIDLFKQAPLTHGARFAGPFDDPMNFAHIYGMYFVFLLILLVYPWLQPSMLQKSAIAIGDFKIKLSSKFLKIDFFFWLVILLTGLSILLSLTRGAWMGVAVSLLVVVFVANLRMGFFFLVGLTSIFALLFQFWHSFHERILQSLNPGQSYDSERLVLWKSNWQMFLDHPFLGVGHGQYKQYLPYYFEKLNIPADHFQSHAHNQYLQALSNTGFIGFLFYICFIFLMIYFSYRAFRKTKNAFFLASLAAQISFHVGAITECNFERSKVRLVYLFFCALTLALIQKYQTKDLQLNVNTKGENS